MGQALLTFLAHGAALFAVGAVHAESTARPNVLVVVADDVGFSDLGAYGSEIRTPNIDAIAERGVRFANFHASPMCSPSRAMLLTGVDSHRTGLASLYVATPLRHRGKPGYEGELRGDVLTLATRLSEVGYRTYLSGKWNLGHSPGSLPSARGFDRTFALDSTGADNFEKKPYLPIYDEVHWFADGRPTDLPEDFYSSEFLVDQLIEFLEQDYGSRRDAEKGDSTDDSGAAVDRASPDRPFFACLSFQAVHLPVQAPREWIRRYEGVYDGGWEALRAARHRGAVAAGVFPETAVASMTPEQADWNSLPADERAHAAKSMAVNAAMLEAMDHHFGRLLTYLEQKGLYDDTILVVLSDNGPEAADPVATPGFSSWMQRIAYSRDLETLGEKGSYAFIGPHFARAAASPLAYYKFHAGEGGIRVPLIISGPGIGARGVTQSFAFVTDIAPTLLELTGTPERQAPGLVPIDGRSLAPTLSDPRARVYPDSAAIGLETAGQAALFRGDYKLVRVGAPAGDGEWRLFDLAKDPGETHDLASAEPDRFASMLEAYEAYAERVGVLEVPRFYSPVRQLMINYFYQQAREHRIALGLLAVLVLVTPLSILRAARRIRARRL